MIKTKHQRTREPAPLKPDHKLPFIEHIYELRRRLFYVAASIVFFSIAGYFVQQQLVNFLLKPAKGQQFIYTTPAGGLNFLFQVCIYFGIALSIPVVVYQGLRYIEPLIRFHTRQAIIRFSLCSWLLAIAGASFGYFVGLPVALNFLSHQFTSVQIKPLLTIQEYLSFVTIYLMGSALLFQIPLILLIINRIKPLSPKKLLGFERYLIVIAFIAGAIMTPTPDVFNQALFAGPIIAVYQVAILLIYLRNRKRRPAPVREEVHRDITSLPNPFMPAQEAAPLLNRVVNPVPSRVARASVWDIA